MYRVGQEENVDGSSVCEPQSSEEEDMDDEDVYSEISDLSQIADDDLYTVDQINSFLDVTKAKPILVEQYFSGF